MTNQLFHFTTSDFTYNEVFICQSWLSVSACLTAATWHRTSAKARHNSKIKHLFWSAILSPFIQISFPHTEQRRVRRVSKYQILCSFCICSSIPGMITWLILKQWVLSFPVAGNKNAWRIFVTRQKKEYFCRCHEFCTWNNVCGQSSPYFTDDETK